MIEIGSKDMSSLVAENRSRLLEAKQEVNHIIRKDNIMPKFMCTHTIPPGAFSADQLQQFAQAAQQDPKVKGYRSFANLTEGKAICVMEAPSEDEVTAWFTKMEMPYDSVTQVELEGDRGTVSSA